MIISHRKKFAFFANQKTGSKAVGLMLRLSGIFDKDDIMMAQPFPATRTADINLPAYNLGKYSTYEVNHMTPSQAIEAGFITIEQLREYDCYAFLRDPEERYKAVRAAMQMDRNSRAASPNNKAGSIAPPQYEFFYIDGEQVVTPLNFDDLENEVRMLIDKLDGYTQTDVAQITTLYKVRMPFTQVKFDPKHHMEDVLLYRKMIKSDK